jgi:hypothetical protein
MDYVMTQTRNEAYMEQFPPELLTFFYSIPAWAIASWAIAVWGGVFGSILLLFRRQVAVWVLLASFVGLSVTAFQNYVLSNGAQVMGDPFSIGFTVAIFLIALLLFLYARAMRERGLLV